MSKSKRKQEREVAVTKLSITVTTEALGFYALDYAVIGDPNHLACIAEGALKRYREK